MSNSSSKNAEGRPNLFGELASEDVGGATLRAAREAAGFDIADLATELRIPKSYLEALETEQYDILPGATYGFGYIRSYCKFLKIDPQPFLDKFKMQMARSDIRPNYHFPDEVLEPRMSGAMISMLLVLVLLGGYLGWQMLDRFDLNPLTKPQIIVAETETTNTEQPSVNEEAVIAQTEQPVASDVAQSGEEVAAPAETVVAEVAAPKAETKASQIATDTQTAEAEAAEEASADDAVQTDSAVIAETAADEDKAEGEVSASQTDVVDTGEQNANTSSALATAREPADEIIISAIAPSWVEVVRENGDVVLNKLFKPGDQYVSPSDTKLYLSTGNAGGLVLTLPGMSEFNVGQTGEIIRDLPLSRDSLRSRRSALINQ